MLRTILVGLDGSEYSETAVRLGIGWAKRGDRLLVGLGIIDEPEIRGPMAMPIGGGAFKGMIDESRMVEARVRVQQCLEQFALACGEAGVSHKLLEDEGLPAEQIVVEAQRFDLILMGQQTYFHFETQSGPGDTLMKVLRNTPRPVITVPKAPDIPSDAVVVAYDGSLAAARALQSFQNLGLGQAQPVHIVSVHKDKDEAARRASRAAEFLGFHQIEATMHSIESGGAPAKWILEKSSQLGAGLIVMGTYGKPTLKEFFLGSVTSTILDESPVPLFLFH